MRWKIKEEMLSKKGRERRGEEMERVRREVIERRREREIGRNDERKEEELYTVTGCTVA